MSIYSFIPHHIGNQVILNVYDLPVYLKKLPNLILQRRKRFREEAAGRQNINDAIWNTRGLPFIDSQSVFADMKYGKKDIRYAGCGVVALYNLLSYREQMGERTLDSESSDEAVRNAESSGGTARNEGTSGKAVGSSASSGREKRCAGEEHEANRLPALIRSLEQSGMIRGGEWGTSPKAILRELKRRGVPLEVIVRRTENGEADRVLREYDSFLMTLYNDRDDIRKMIHTVSIIRQQDGALRIYNADGMHSIDVRTDTLDDLMKAFPGGKAKPILFAGVGTPHHETKNG